MNYSRPAMGLAADEGEASFPPIGLPRVSVIVTCFNYGQYIGQALDSVAGQTYPEFNCVIVDDASTDDSVAVVERWLAARKDPRFRLIRNAVNGGQMATFAAGLAVSESEFVAFLDADDIWFPQFLQRHIEVHLNRVQYAGASCSDLAQINNEGKALSGMTTWPTFDASVQRGGVFPFEADDLPLFDLNKLMLKLTETTEVRYYLPTFTWHWSVTSGMMFRRALIEILIPNDSRSVRICADFYLMVLCHYFTGTLRIEDALGGYRRHGKNQFSSLPVLGGNSALSPPTPHIQQQKKTFEAMLLHVLERHDTLAASFSEMKVRRLVRLLFRRCLLGGIPIDDPRLSNVLGRGRVFRDRMRSKIKFLRRKLMT